MSNYSESTFKASDPNSSWNKTFALIPEGSKVIDVGCSSGNFGSELIKKKNCTVDGIEINPEDIKEARSKLRRVYEINIEKNITEITEAYDIVFMGDVIEHLADPVNALKNIKKLLKPKGGLVFSIPNITHMSVRLMLLEGKIEYGKTGLLDETHLHFYNYEEVVRVLNSAGYAIKKMDNIEKDVPVEVLERELKRMGLKMEDKFIDIAQSVNGGAYQFIGVAEVGNIAMQALPQKSPINVTDKYIKEWRKEHKQKHEQLEAKINDLKKGLALEKEAKKDLKQELDSVYNSKIWVMSRKVKKILNTLKIRKK